MELENLVEKIAREVMDSLKEKQGSTPINGGSTSNRPSTGPVFESGVKDAGAVLLCGSPVDSDTLKKAVSYIRKNNFNLTVAVSPGVNSINEEGVTIIRCGYTSDCSAPVHSSNVVIIMLNDIASVSRLANLAADRFDVEGVLYALEEGKEVWGLNLLRKIPSGLSKKVDCFLKEIESFGVKLFTPDLLIKPAVKSVTTQTQEPTPAVCSMNASGDCAGCGLCLQLVEDKVKQVVDQGADRVSSAPGLKTIEREVGKMIDHTLLKPDATRDQIIKLCEEAKKYNFASCCVNPAFVALTAECLKDSPVKTCTVIGFPLGATTSMVKSMETRDAIAAGADEIDMVINVGALKAGDYDLVRRDIEAVVNSASGRIVKVIIETALLTDEEKVKACQLAKQAGADFVKTSTGFGPGGATAKDVALMRQTVGKYMGVKASGGIRDYAIAEEMIKAGATRIGASASVAIVKHQEASGSGY